MIRVSAGGREASHPADLERGTLVELFLEGLERYADTEAMLRRRQDGSWEALTHREVGDRVRDLARGLRSLGLGRGDRVALVSDTRMEWALADFALVMSGLVSVPVYPSLPPDQVRYLLGNAGARAAFVEDGEQYAKLEEVREALPELERAFAFEPVEGGELPVQGLDELAAAGRSGGEGGYLEEARRAEPDDLVTLIYTSGTTGRPKGVMLSQDNFASNVEASCRVLPVGPDDVALSWLPLSHVFERMAGHYLMWSRGVTVAYYDGSIETLVRDMGEVRPTIMNAVPRLYEKLVERAEAKARDGGALSEAVFRWARSVGEERARKRLADEPVGPWLALQHRVADRLVFRKLRDRTGGRLRYFVSGGAPLPPAVGLFLWAADLPVLEGYGLTETSPVLCVNPPDAPRLGTVGPPVAGTELRIAEDGEILARGPQVMRGYYDAPEATAEVMEEDGFFHTGDVGELDEEGYLSITDRKKELVVLATGKKVAPSPVENAVNRSRFIEYSVLIGDRRKFPIVVVQPSFDELRAWGSDRGLGGADPEALVASEAVRSLIREEVEAATRDFAHHETPGEILLVPDSFSVTTGELTPTMKVKRRVVLDRYREDIERVYREADREEEAAVDAVKVAGEEA